MKRAQWRIEAASRLHFGLLSFGHRDDRRQYGGVGLMIERPGLCLAAEPHEGFTATGPLGDRLTEFAERWQEHAGIEGLPSVRLAFHREPPQHVGLGTGTQVALACAALLNRLCDRPTGTAAELAQAVGRAQRSSVGTHGFLHGGLIYEAGRRPAEPVGRLVARVDLPAAWRVVLIRPTRQQGLHGEAERRVFRRVEPVPPARTERLRHEIEARMLPAAEAAQFDAWSESIYQYGRMAGECFANQQGGPYANARLQNWVDRMRAHGIAGVGQSSWGPTLFALANSESQAQEIATWFRGEMVTDDDRLTIEMSPLARVGHRWESATEAPLPGAQGDI